METLVLLIPLSIVSLIACRMVAMFRPGLNLERHNRHAVRLMSGFTPQRERCGGSPPSEQHLPRFMARKQVRSGERTGDSSSPPPYTRSRRNLRLLGDFYVLEEHVEPPSRSCNDWQYGFDRLYTPTYKGNRAQGLSPSFFDNFVGRCGSGGLRFPIKFPYSQLCTRARRFESMTQSPSSPSAAALAVLVASLVKGTAINTIYPLSAFILSLRARHLS